MSASPALPYRADVDGLRAIAVLAVLAFHGFPAAAPGGFAGVDIFFVISGFLISGIILDGLARGTFSFADFYWRRVRRIFPALILVLAACLAAGWLLLLPDEYNQLGKHIVAAAAFLSNFAFWREAGYFDGAADLKPLLHLWSLGVEEQYYLVWPLALFLLRNRPRLMAGMIAAGGLASLALSVWLTQAAPVAAFYLPVTRFWELLAGSLLAWLAARGRLSARFADAKALAGLALIAAAFALLSAERDFPGWWALLPVGGAALLIAAGPRAWVNRRLLANRGMVYVGLISYPLYLWHWPLLSFARIVQGGEPPVAARIALLVAAIVLACLTYELIEKHIRRAQLPVVRRAAVPALAASMAALAVGGALALKNAMPAHSASIPFVREIAQASADWAYPGDRVIVGDSTHTVLFFGDSHMQHYWPRVAKLVDERARPVRTVIFKTTGGCAPVPGIERRGQHCSPFVEKGFALAQRPEVDIVVIAASWVGFLNRGDYYKVGDADETPLKLITPETEWVMQGFAESLQRLVAKGKRVVIVLSSPRGDAFDPKSLVRRDGMVVHVGMGLAPVPRMKLASVTWGIDSRLRRIAAATGASVLDPTDWLCGRDACPAADEQGRPLYKDDSHLRASYAREHFTAFDSYVYLPAPP